MSEVRIFQFTWFGYQHNQVARDLNNILPPFFYSVKEWVFCALFVQLNHLTFSICLFFYSLFATAMPGNTVEADEPCGRAMKRLVVVRMWTKTPGLFGSV